MHKSQFRQIDPYDWFCSGSHLEFIYLVSLGHRTCTTYTIIRIASTKIPQRLLVLLLMHSCQRISTVVPVSHVLTTAHVTSSEARQRRVFVSKAKEKPVIYMKQGAVIRWREFCVKHTVSISQCKGLPLSSFTLCSSYI